MPKRISVRKRDNSFQRMEVLLSNREKRTRYKEFLVEGVIPINRLLAGKWPVRAFVYASGRELSDWAKGILGSADCQEHIDLSSELMADLSQKVDTSELLAIASMKEDDISLLAPRRNGFVLVMDRPISPGNLGSSIRSAESFGVDGVVVSGHAVDIYDPQTVRSSRGAIFSLPVIRAPSHKEVAAWIAQAKTSGFDYRVIGTDADVPQKICDLDFTHSCVIIMGNETSGLSKAYRELCSDIVQIPMSGSSDSLNVSCAASICMYEVIRQRQTINLESDYLKP